MRLDIYELALLDAQPARFSLSLLQTCRHINMEARPTLYKRPTSFTSQAKLFEWIDRSRPQDLKRVRTLKIRLTHVDLTPMLDLSAVTAQDKRPSLETLHQAELERLDSAFRALPSLASLTIVPPKTEWDGFLRRLYHSFLRLLPKRCPKLKRLELHNGEEVLEAVPALKEVSEVVCTGNAPQSSGSKKGRKLRKSEQLNEMDRIQSLTKPTADASPSSEAVVSPKSKMESSQQRKDSGQTVDGTVDA